MQCREGCGACCIAPSISAPFKGMPNGKPANVRCVHLDDDMRCKIFGKPERPALCADFKAEPSFCGASREEAMTIICSIEIMTS